MTKNLLKMSFTVILLFSCTKHTPLIERHPPPETKEIRQIIAWNEIDLWLDSYDLQGLDLSALDLRDKSTELFNSAFNTQTIWPSKDKLPPNFDPKKILEIGKNPGLGVKKVHSELGMTGKNVSIAIIDQPLLVTHQEYKDQLVYYREIGISPNMPAQMHGPAVASIAVGKNVGVAPNARLYYFAAMLVNFNENKLAECKNNRRISLDRYTQAVNEIIELNKKFPKEQKIRVISISRGWGKNSTPCVQGVEQMEAAVQQAQAAGIFVVTANSSIQGLGRDPQRDPDLFDSYRFGKYWAQDFSKALLDGGADSYFDGEIMIPMDSRTYAAPTGDHDYAYDSEGGMSWAVPWLAGLYTLACEADPKMTPERFYDLARQTGHSVTLKDGDAPYTLGPIVDAHALIQRITRERKSTIK